MEDFLIYPSQSVPDKVICKAQGEGESQRLGSKVENFSILDDHKNQSSDVAVLNLLNYFRLEKD